MFIDPGPEKALNCPTSCTFVGVNPATPFLIISQKPEALVIDGLWNYLEDGTLELVNG